MIYLCFNAGDLSRTNSLHVWLIHSCEAHMASFANFIKTGSDSSQLAHATYNPLVQKRSS